MSIFTNGFQFSVKSLLSLKREQGAKPRAFRGRSPQKGEEKLAPILRKPQGCFTGAITLLIPKGIRKKLGNPMQLPQKNKITTNKTHFRNKRKGKTWRKSLPIQGRGML